MTTTSSYSSVSTGFPAPEGLGGKKECLARCQTQPARLRHTATNGEPRCRRSPFTGLLPGLIVAAVLLSYPSAFSEDIPIDPLAWPVAVKEAKPWTRWWWLGSAVDEKNITRQLEQCAATGLGGVEICPIYGAMGAESRFLRYLSPEWMKMLAHTTREATRLGLGVDLTTGTGWPFGGPMVGEDHAAGDLEMVKEGKTGNGANC